MNRLELKVAASAQFAMTQAVFDVRLIEEMRSRTQHLPIQMSTGVWPLLSGRQAEFLHNEVPGIIVPDFVRAEIAGCDDAEGRLRGLRLAKNIAAAALSQYSDVYLIKPFL